MKPAQLFTARILQRWLIVVALAVVGGLVAAAAAFWSDQATNDGLDRDHRPDTQWPCPSA